MAANTQASQPCCSVVCLVPAGVAAQSMQMFMVAPMATPVMIPQFSGFSGSDMTGFAGAPAASTTEPFAWSAEGAWQYFDGSSFGEEAPMQLPMGAVVPQQPPAGMPAYPIECIDWESAVQANSGQFQEEVPSQIRMRSRMVQSQTMEHVPTNEKAISGTLRHRRKQNSSLQGVCNVVTEALGSGRSGADQQMGTDTETIQAREIAHRLLEEFRAGGNAQQAAVTSFQQAAFASKISSRAAQMILEETSMTDAAAFATGLRGHVRSAMESKHANHVVQKITEVMPVAHASFVVDELKGFGREVARHSFGCRVLCRILEHLSAHDVGTIELIEEVLEDLNELCSHSFGSFVVRHLLEFGLPGHRRRVARALFTDVAGYAKHKFGSHVVEAALRHGNPDDQQALARELLGDKRQLMVLAAHPFGRHVVRALLAIPGSLKEEVVSTLESMQSQLKSSRYGKSVWQALRAASSA